MARRSLFILLFIFNLLFANLSFAQIINLKKNNLNKESTYLKWLLLPEGVYDKNLKDLLILQYGSDTITYEISDSTLKIIKPKKKASVLIFHGKKTVYYRGRNSIYYTEFYDYGRLNGISTKYYRNRQIFSTYQINYGDTINGIEYDSAGLKRIEYIAEDVKILKTTYLNGIKKSIKTIDRKTKLLNGPMISYFENGSLKTESFYAKGIIDSVSKTYFLNGAIDSLINYKNSLREGDCMYYHKNSKIRARCMYKQNVMEGMFYQYYTNGQLEKSVFFVNGDKNGIESRYQPDGTLVSEINFKDNIEQGPYKLYHKNINLVFEKGNYVDGYKQGVVEFYSTDGTLVNSVNYNNGKKVVDGNY